MNPTLPPRDRLDRGRASCWQSRRRGTVPGAVRLVGGAAYPPERQTPPGRSPAARCDRSGKRSGFDRVGALAVLALRGGDRQAHFLSDGTLAAHA